MDDRTAEKRQIAAAAGTIDRKYGKGRNDDVPRGIICMVVATILFAAASAASKWLVGLYPVGEVLCLRSFASLAAGAAMILPVSGLSAFVRLRKAARQVVARTMGANTRLSNSTRSGRWLGINF